VYNYETTHYVIGEAKKEFVRININIFVLLEGEGEAF